MAQGAVKKAAKQAKSAKPVQKHGISKPQKPKKKSGDKLLKKHSSGLIGKTEKLLAERAGHVELIGKGKKGKKDDGEKQKGGTRKFG